MNNIENMNDIEKLKKRIDKIEAMLSELMRRK